MSTTICKDCWKAHKENGWYMSDQYKKTANVPDCSLHPVMTNWRVFRSLNTIKHFTLQHVGYKHISVPSGFDLVLAGGHVHERSLKLVLFDYEVPYVDLLVKEKYLKRHDKENPTTLTVTAKGDEFIRANQKARADKASAAV